MKQYKGTILKGIGGFYYVESADGIFECKAKGKFRNQRITPLAGDKVLFTVNDSAENTIDEIEKRKNELHRPPVANIDALMIVVSCAEPSPNFLVIDKMTVLAQKNNIEPVVIITKSDLHSSDEIESIYSKTPFKIFKFSKDDYTQADELLSFISGKLVAFTGNSGVGKSTLLNHLCPSLSLQTGEISQKLGRGRHTTRHAEIFHVADGMIIDTAGFSSVDFLASKELLKDDLQFYFPEFSEALSLCRFTGCSHVADKGCEICRMVEQGIISESRHNSYVSLYNELKNVKQWQV